MKALKIGDYVKTANYGYTGRIYGFEDRRTISDDWFDLQTIQPTEDQKNGVWVKVLVHEGGAVVCAYNTVKRVPKFKLENRDTVETFGEQS